jgi:hypothetical protein
VSSANNDYFADVVFAQEELDGAEVAKKIFDVAVVEDALEAELWSGLQLELIFAGDVIPVVRRVRSCIFRMEEAK